MSLKAQALKSDDWMKRSQKLIDGVQFDTSDRLRISIGYFHICVEHQTAIHLLICHNVKGSALALLRPQFEAYVRGVWFHRCATDDQVQEFIAGKQPPTIDELIASIQKENGFEDGSLKKSKAASWKNLNDYTHGGKIQIFARVNADEIASNYNDDHIASSLMVADIYSYLAGQGIAAAAEYAELAKNLDSEFEAVYQDDLKDEVE